MRRRRAKALWGVALSRGFERWARAAARAGRQAMKAAAPRPSRARAPRATAGEPGWTAGVAGFGAVVRRFRLYRPPGLDTAGTAPLVVLLHGCGQDAAGFAAATRIARAADRAGFLVLCPEQDRRAHPNACWRWYDTRTGRAQAEAGAILAAIAQAVRLHRADPARVAIAGLSAGAGMAGLIASRAPERFAAVAMHSGVGPGAADSTAGALAAMQGRRRPHLDTPTAPLPPLLVIHGSADTVVRPVNGVDIATAWAAASGATATAPRTVRRGARRPMRIVDFRRAGRVRVSLCEVEGLGHAWSGGAAAHAHADPDGPEATRLIATFFARAFAGG